MQKVHRYINKYFLVDSLENKEEKYKTYVLIYSVLFGTAFLSILIVLNEFLHFHTSGGFSLALLFAGIYLFCLKRNVNLIYIGNIIALGFFIAQVIDATSSGGIFYLGLFWAILTPMVAFCFANLRSGIFWTGVIVVYSFCLYYFEISAVESSFGVAVKTPEFYLIATIGLFLYIAMLLAVFKQGNDLIIEELKEQKLLLKKQKKETLEKAEMLEKVKVSLIEKNGALEEAKVLLSQQNKELEQFAYATSHDLKSPLRTIKSFSEILDKHLNHKGWIDEHTEEYMDFILKGSNNMDVFITDLLEYASIGIGTNSYTDTNLNEVLSSVKESLFESIQSTDTTIVSGKLPTLPIIPIKITQLFQNLIANAIKFRKKEEDLVLEIIAKELPTHWQFIVKDNGIGIDEKNLEVVFQPFKKLHTKEEYCGSGIGLSTCQKIVEMHGGKIWVKSTLGKGTCFYFTISKHIKEVTDLKKINAPKIILN